MAVLAVLCRALRTRLRTQDWPAPVERPPKLLEPCLFPAFGAIGRWVWAAAMAGAQTADSSLAVACRHRKAAPGFRSSSCAGRTEASAPW